MDHFTQISDGDLAQRVGYVNKLGANLDVPVYFSLVPDKSWAWAMFLPDNAPNVDDGSTLRRAEELCGDSVTFINLSLLGITCGNTQSPDEDSSFYRTDHHWTSLGAYRGYYMLMDGMGLPQSVVYTQPVTRYPEGSPIEGGLYYPEKLAAKDKYAYFLGGNQPLCVIQNPDAVNGKLLVIRDSYADSLAPFLAEEFQEVHLFDLRYNNTPLKQYVTDNSIDQVLVLYSANNFNTDKNLFKLAL